MLGLALCLPAFKQLARAEGAPTDPFFSNVTFLTHHDGTNGSTVLVDEKGHTYTAFGGAALTTTPAKWGTASLASNASGNYTEVPASADFSFGTAPVTIDWWQYVPSTIPGGVTNRHCWIVFQAGVIDWGWRYLPGSDRFQMYNIQSVNSFTVYQATAANAPPKDQWVYYQLVRNGTSLVVYENGVSIMNIVMNASHVLGVASAPFRIGANGVAAEHSGCFFDDFRITKGVARANTVPTAAFPNS